MSDPSDVLHPHEVEILRLRAERDELRAEVARLRGAITKIAVLTRLAELTLAGDDTIGVTEHGDKVYAAPLPAQAQHDQPERPEE